jgi:HAD superfamily hydrolase (TIGR01450 family)
VTWVLDLDGVVWLADQPIPGAAEAVAHLRAAGERVLFCTNNSYAPVAAQEAKLAGVGIPASGDVVTSAMAAAALVQPGERALVFGGPGVVEALEARGAVVLGRTADGAGETVDGPVDVVVAGFHRDFDYEGLRRAAGAVRRGARLLATNDDATYPTPAGPIPGGGALAAALAYAGGADMAVAGKPHVPMADVIRALAARSDGAAHRGDPASRVQSGAAVTGAPGDAPGTAPPPAGGDGTTGVMVGDRPETDGRFARALGYRFALVLTGVTARDDLPVDPEPEVVADDLAALVTQLVG